MSEQLVSSTEPAPAVQLPSVAAPADQRNDFTSEAFKIEIRNISNYGFGEIKKFLRKKLELNPVKIKGQSGFRDLVYVCFRNEEERTEALGKLNGYVWKGKTIKAAPAAAVADPMAQKRAENNQQQSAHNNSRDRPTTTAKRTILEATAPLAHLAYAEQLRQKEADLLDILRSYADQAHRLNRSLNLRSADRTALPCRWLGFRPAPQPDGYRNKSEFTIGCNAAGERVVGFRLGAYVNGSVEVDAVDALPHIPERMKLAASVWQSYVRQSEYEPFSPEFYRGVWRQLTVRVSVSSGAVMLVIGVHSQPLDAAQLAALKADIARFLQESEEGKRLAATSVYLEHMNKREAGQMANVVEHLLGDTHIWDSILGLRFRISPESFFQVNTQAAEVLYQAAIDLAAPNEKSTVLDICCGTGTIGLCFAKYCRRVLGVEIIPQAIEDAGHNARENGVENCQFYAGNCDDYIRKFVHEHRNGVDGADGGEVMAIIDPPRAGLHIKSIASLRSSKGLDRFVYISCSPKAALRNWVDLARPSSKAYKGAPFVVTAAIGVDMFPHTHHKEMVLLFERVKEPEEVAEVNTEAMEVVATSTEAAPSKNETAVSGESAADAAVVSSADADVKEEAKEEISDEAMEVSDALPKVESETESQSVDAVESKVEVSN